MSENSELKKRKHVSFEQPLLMPKSVDDLPYGGKVFLARQKKPDTWPMFLIQIGLVLFAIGGLVYTYYYFDHVHYHVTHQYAKMGYDSAQHHMGVKYLHGIGVEKHEEKAMEWFKKAADQGHPHASYNLAIGHLRGLKSGLQEGSEAKKLIEHAAANGVPEAHHAWHSMCKSGACED